MLIHSGNKYINPLIIKQVSQAFFFSARIFREKIALQPINSTVSFLFLFYLLRKRHSFEERRELLILNEKRTQISFQFQRHPAIERMFTSDTMIIHTKSPQ